MSDIDSKRGLFSFFVSYASPSQHGLAGSLGLSSRRLPHEVEVRCSSAHLCVSVGVLFWVCQSGSLRMLWSCFCFQAEMTLCGFSVADACEAESLRSCQP